MIVFLAFYIPLIMGLLIVIWIKYKALKRAQFIRSFELPKGLFERLRKHHPHLALKDCQLVSQGLRHFFLAHLKSKRRYVSMPSQVVDDLWHEFILYTKAYEKFCSQAFGRFLHHTPAVALAPQHRTNNIGLRRCWWYTCKEENINPRAASRLPLLFALDAKLKITNGFHYSLHCKLMDNENPNDQGNSPYCGTDFSDKSFDGTTEGFGWTDSDGTGTDLSADGGGDGGGCGGGCGGGGD